MESNSKEESSCTHSQDSSESIDVEVKNGVPTLNEILMLTNQSPYITDHDEFLSKMENYASRSYVMASDDLIIACAALVKYNDVRGCLAKKTKKVINSMVESLKIENTDKIAIFFCPRFVNIPVSNVFDLYNHALKDLGEFSHILFISRLYVLNKEEHQESIATFKEFSKDDLRMFPYRSEEIFLLSCPNRHNTEIDGLNYRIILANCDEVKRFLEAFSSELDQQ